MVQEHMKSANRNAAGPSLKPGGSRTASAAQAVWRFLGNENVTLKDLIEPLRDAGRDACRQSSAKYVLLAHDWSKLDYKSHTSKADLRQITHDSDVGYELTTALLVDAESGNPLAPMQMHLKTAEAVHSTGSSAPEPDTHRLDQITPTMQEAEQWGLERPVVHVIDREADSLGRLREWDAQGHFFLVRSDDRRVKWKGKSILISEIAEQFKTESLFDPVGEALFHGKPVAQEVAAAEIILHRPHSKVIDGEKRTVTGRPLRSRLVITRLVDEDNTIVAQWTLLSNVFDDAISGHQIALWYYWRWRIESFFKLLKSHGQELEQWQQRTGEAVARRILVASMACVVVLELQRDDSPEAAKTKKILVRLSGRQMKHGRSSTAPALLAGYMALLSINDLLADPEVDIGELQRIAADTLPFKVV